MSQYFASGGQSIEVSASASVLSLNIQDLSPLGLTSLISLQSKGLSRVFSNTTVQKHQFLGAQLYGPTLTSIHDDWKNHNSEYMGLCLQSVFNYFSVSDILFLKKQLFNMSSLVIALLPRSKNLLISWLQSPYAVILEPKKINCLTAVATGLEKVSFHSNSKERQCQRMLKLPHNCTHLTR